MLDRAYIFIKEHGDVIKDQASYLREVDWSFSSIRRDRKLEHKLHIKILAGFVSKMQTVIKEAGDDTKDPKVKKFNTALVKELERYIERATNYFDTERWQEYEESEDVADEKAEEIDFQEDILKNVISFKKEISKLNVEQKVKNVVIPIHSDKIVSIPMKRMFDEMFPEIPEFIKRK